MPKRRSTAKKAVGSSRTPTGWVCSRCGQDGGRPDGFVALDSRYQVGLCPDCSTVRTNRHMPLVRVDIFDRAAFSARAEVARLQAVYDKGMRGLALSKEELVEFEIVKSQKLARLGFKT